MAVKKEGELRIRRGEAIYGPMSRGDLDAMLASRRFTLTDLVSVWGGPWMEIHQYLAPADSAAKPAAPLRVLHGERMFGALSHEQLTQLHEQGRIAGADLVCALGGPWMSVADFLSPPRPLAAADEPVEQDELDEPDDLEEPVDFEEEDDGPRTWYRVYSGDLEDQLSDQWFVRVRGIHSAPLTRQQVRQLLFAGEITSRNVARHLTWQEDYWRPIWQIAELDIRD